MRGIHILLLMLSIGLLGACVNDDLPIPENNLPPPTLEYFAFLKENNPQLTEDVIVPIENDSVITTFIPYTKTDSLVATFSGNFITADIGGVIQESGKTVNNFSFPIKYIIHGENSQQKTYYVMIKGHHGLPIISIETENQTSINSKTEYVKGKIAVYNCEDSLTENCSIRGRGNASWTVPQKKSYKIKLDNKRAPFGFSSQKDWVLLAEPFDKTLLRCTYMFEVSKAAKMPFTCNYKHVELYLNGDFRGTYLFTDHIEKKKDRVQIDKDGFFIEHDGYYKNEPLFFRTDSFGYAYTFKYPSANDGDIVENDDNFLFISNYMNRVEKSILKTGEDNLSDLIDYESFAKWYVVQELLDNLDPNLFFTMRNESSKLEMGPIWDADWSLGYASEEPDGSWKKRPYEPQPDEVAWRKKYYVYLLQDPLFVNEVLHVWETIKPRISDIKEKVSQEKELIKYSQEANFKKWPNFGKYIGPQLVAFDSWEEEVEYVSWFFAERATWMDNYITDLTNTQ